MPTAVSDFHHNWLILILTFGDEWQNLRKNGWAIEISLQSLFLLSLFEYRFDDRSAHIAFRQFGTWA
ncbi:MAG: hypothetical protein ACBR11_05845 [Microcoleus sp.]|uniref:hypothetical protein n=1 Tax=Microcoleus sp. TaxID=44472 RepID=UPI003525E0BD